LYEPAGDDVGYCRELLDVIFDHNLQEKETPAIEKWGRMSFRQATALLVKVARRVKSRLTLEMDESVQILPFRARDELLKDSWREILRAYSSRDVSWPATS
jgi:hypothetical protein